MILSRVIIERSSLQSNIIRQVIGERIVNLSEDYAAIRRSEGSFLSQAFNLTKKFVGFIVSTVLTGIYWSFSDLWDVVVEAYFELKYFDWNQTDAELKQQLKNNDDVMAGALGRLAGTGLVWLTGIAVSTGLSFKYPVLSGKIALALAEEGGQEIRSAVTNLIITSRTIAIQNVLLGGLLNARKLEIFGFKPVTEAKKPWTINDGIERSIQSLSSSRLRAFATQFIDAAEDAVIEMGYVISYTLDDFYLAHRQAQQSVLGQNRTIELTPDIRVEEERIIIESPQELAVSTIQTTIASHQLIHNRDVGQIAGVPEADVVRPVPQRRKMKIIFRSKQAPPWKLENGETSATVEMSIPDVKKGTTWQDIKSTVKKYTWGKYYVTALLDNGRQMRCYCVSYSEGEKQINEALKLSTATLVKFFHGVVATDDPNPAKRKVPTLVYPAFAKLIEGDINRNGTLRSKKKNTIRVALWTDEPPENADQLL